MSRPSVGPYPKLFADRTRNSISAQTWEEYAMEWRNWNLFCNNYNINAFQLNINVMLNYLSSLMDRHLSVSTISKNVAGIFFFLKLNELKDITKYFQVKQALKDIKN